MTLKMIPRLTASAWCLVAMLAQPLSTLAQPVAGRMMSVNAAACPQAGTGVFAGKKWAKCAPSAVSDGSLRMVVEADLEGEGAAMKPRNDTAGKRCDVTVAAGRVSVSAPGFKASAALDAEPEDSLVRTNDGRTFINAASASDNSEIALEFDPREGMQSAQARIRGRMLTCGRS